MACKFDVFVSYSSADRDLVAPFVELLKRDDFTVWFDIEQMAGGPPVLGQIADGIANSTHMIACLSDAYVEREWTAFELDSNQTHDPANRRNRTIPVRFRPLTRKLPAQIHAFAVRDLTDVTKFQTEYKHITRMLRRHAPQEPNELDREGISRACKAPFKHLDEPNVALFLVRRANEALSQFLYLSLIHISEPTRPY